MSKVGIALITCDRLNFFKTCLSSILNVTDTFDTLVVVNDGVLDVDNQLLTDVNVYINHEENQGVGPSKNAAMRSLLDQGCEHLFLIEDDVLINDPETLLKYIHASEVTGIKNKCSQM